MHQELCELKISLRIFPHFSTLCAPLCGWIRYIGTSGSERTGLTIYILSISSPSAPTSFSLAEILEEDKGSFPPVNHFLATSLENLEELDSSAKKESNLLQEEISSVFGRSGDGDQRWRNIIVFPNKEFVRKLCESFENMNQNEQTKSNQKP